MKRAEVSLYTYSRTSTDRIKITIYHSDMHLLTYLIDILLTADPAAENRKGPSSHGTAIK